ncbi:MAG: hypothetical protein QNJ81_08825 [Acidimicrobiia bacterium]|nr:hypothetical protein [Acidimicrobiia bacterium]
MRVGSLDWANQTGGNLRLIDRAHLLAIQAPPALLEIGWSWFANALGVRKPLDLSRLEPVIDYVKSRTPATEAAEVADRLCDGTSEDWLYRHCKRTFAYGLLLGADLDVNSEKLYLMAMLHDVGLTASYRHGRDPGLTEGYARSGAECFAVRGAGVAESMSAGGRELLDEVAAGVCEHVNVRVPVGRGVEAHLLQAATALDVGGLRHRDLPQSAIDAVLREWPRGASFRSDVWKAWGCEVGIHPQCRGRFLTKWGRIRRRIYGAPFEDE